MNRTDYLKKIQNYRFAAHDLLLYLDTHPNDSKAFEMYKDLVEHAKRHTAEYETQFGPLTALATADCDSFTWTKSPWPWEKEANQ